MKIKEHSQSFFVLALYMIFVVLALVFLTAGASVYGSITENMDESYEIRTALSYVSTKVRQSAGEVYMENKDGSAVLSIDETASDGETYVSRIYFKDGALWELYALKDADYTLEDGDRLLDVKDLTLEMENGVVTASCETEGGKTSSISLLVRR